MGTPKLGWWARGALLWSFGCSAAPMAAEPAPVPPGLHAEAGFEDIAPRAVTVHGRAVALDATSKLFFNFRPADSNPEGKPLLVLFNGFASDVVRAFGTGPNTVAPDGRVLPNPDSLTRFASLLYFDPRQAGFSYDVIASRQPNDADCSQDVFSEYVDAADVLLGVLQFLKQHPALGGPVYWMGESYAGVRISWMLAYTRGAWGLAPYRDETLEKELSSFDTTRLVNGQILLQPWLVGFAQASAIQTTCKSGALLAAVQATVPTPCQQADACACAADFKRSPYNYTLSKQEQDARLLAADAAQVDPGSAQALYGVRFESIPGLSSEQRARGFKCLGPDSETPDQSALSALLGALPAGQSYNLAYSALTTGKGSTNPDWRQQTLIGSAFLDNARSVPTLITDGARDLVVPEAALASALRAISGDTTVVETSDSLTLNYVSGPRSLAIRHFASSGHMITMMQPTDFANALSAWLLAHAPP